MSIEDNMKQIADLANRLVKEESITVNPISPQDNLFAIQGWQCPICKRVYSPYTHMCRYCGNRDVETTILPNTKKLDQERNRDLIL